MPVLRASPDTPGFVIETSEQDVDVLYQVNEEGERFLTVVLGLHSGDSVRGKDLNLLIERGWATRIPRPPLSTSAPTRVTPTREAPTSPTALRPHAIRRTRSREVALQVLYLIEQNPSVDPAEIDRFVVRRLTDPQLVAFTQELVQGVREHLATLDNLIASVAENWRLDRMAAIDRNILRLGAYEMLHRSDVPPKVAINEALELAKRYSTAQSSRFVNGILDRLQEAPPDSEALQAPLSGEANSPNPDTHAETSSASDSDNAD